MLALGVGLFPATAVAKRAPARAKPPKITQIGCLLRCAEGSPIQIQPGGKLQLWGQGLKRGMVATFPRKSKVKRSKRRVTALVRQRAGAFAVTIPLQTRSGRFKVSLGHGPASNAVGPIKIN